MNLMLGAHAGCVRDEACAQLASDLYATLSTGRYDWPASILDLQDFDAYLAAHRTARKRAARATRLGYIFEPINRPSHIDDIHRINTSTPERQGRPMSDSYLERPSFSELPDYRCERHAIRTYGVFTTGGRLVAYLCLHVCGDVAVVSQILGHAAHLADDVMYLLTLGTFRDTLDRSGSVIAFYNMHSSGTDGLRFFKERLGFAPARVEWALA